MGVRGTSGGPKINLSVRVSVQEAQELRKAAALAGVFVSEFIVRAALEASRSKPQQTAMVYDRR